MTAVSWVLIKFTWLAFGLGVVLGYPLLGLMYINKLISQSTFSCLKDPAEDLYDFQSNFIDQLQPLTDFIFGFK